MLGWIARTLIVAAVLLACLVWADRALYDFLHEHYNYATRPVPDALKVPTRLLRSMEDWGENVFIAGVLFAIWKLDHKRRGRVFCLITAAIATALCTEAIKRCAGRERPEVGKGAMRFHLFTRAADSLGDAHSFPSGHTAAAAAYSGALASFYPPLRPVMLVMASGCGASRIWKERHFLSDCIFACVLGWTISFWFATSPRFVNLWRWCDMRFATSAILMSPDRRRIPGWAKSTPQSSQPATVRARHA